MKMKISPDGSELHFITENPDDLYKLGKLEARTGGHVTSPDGSYNREITIMKVDLLNALLK